MKQVQSQSKGQTIGKKILSQRTIRQASVILIVLLGSFTLAANTGIDPRGGTNELMMFAYSNSVSSDFIDTFCEGTALFIMLSLLFGDDADYVPFVEIIASGDRTLTQNSFTRGIQRAADSYGFDQMGFTSSDVSDNLVVFYANSSDSIGFLLYYPNFLITRAGFCLAKLEF